MYKGYVVIFDSCALLSESEFTRRTPAAMAQSYGSRIWETLHIDALVSSRKAQLITTAIIASAVTGGAIFSFQKLNRRKRTKQIKDDIPIEDDWSEIDTPIRTSQEWDESLIREQLARNLAFLGDDGLDKVRKGFVIVVGAGGVGSWAATMLLRSGIGRLRIIDFDQVTLSSLNRHAVATHNDVGTPKVIALQTHFKQIAPWTQVEAWVDLFRKDDAHRLLLGNPDFVIDAIDNIDTKVDLLAYCHQNNIPVVSSMGAGAKADPSLIQISDLSATQEDPLARSVRQKLKKHHNVSSGITVVYSTEKPSKHVSLLPLADEEFTKLADGTNEDREAAADVVTRAQNGKANVGDLAILPDFRVRILPVLGPLPAMFGLAAATHIITTLAQFPGVEPIPIKSRRGDKVLSRMHRELCSIEARHFLPPAVPGGTGESQLSFDVDEAGYIYDEVFKARSVVAPEFSSSRTTLVRWRPTDRGEPLKRFNVACMTVKEHDRHIKEVLLGGKSVEEVWGAATCEKFNQRWKQEAELDKWR